MWDLGDKVVFSSRLGAFSRALLSMEYLCELLGSKGFLDGKVAISLKRLDEAVKLCGGKLVGGHCVFYLGCKFVV